jgi:outer membrane protein OmpA-like peptidoglycan-associated protein
MVVCPVCRNATSAKFMWYRSEEEGMCLMCHHQQMRAEKHGDSGAKLTSSKSQQAEFFVKIGGGFAAILALVVGGIYLFYKPKPMTPPPPLGTLSRLEKDGKSGKGKKLKPGETKAEDGKVAENGASGAPGGKAAEAEKAKMTVAAALAGVRERVAPTVNALLTELKTAKAKLAGEGEFAKPGALSDAGGIAASLGIKAPDMAGPGATNLNPNQKTKEKMLTAKDTVLAVASAVIDKNDADGTKTAEALGKLGAVSTMFADVATKLTEGSGGPANGSGGADAGGSLGFGGMSKPAAGSLKLEADILEAQGRAGYDVMDLMQREADAEKSGKSVTSINVMLDPEAARRKREMDRAEALQRALTNTVKGAAPKGIGAAEKASDPAAKNSADAAGMKPNTLVAKLNDLAIKLNLPTLKLNDTTIKLNDLNAIKLNSLDMDLSKRPVAEGPKFNDTAIRLNDTSIRLNDTTIRLNSTAIHLNGSTRKLNELNIRLNATAVKLTGPTLGVNVAAMKVNTALVSLITDTEIPVAPVAKSAGPVTQRIETVMKVGSLPPGFAVAAGLNVSAPAGRNAKPAKGADLPVLVLSIRGTQLFGSNSATLLRDGQIGLREYLGLLLVRAPVPVLIRASSDGYGSPAENAELAEKRAEAIRTWLTATGCVTAKNTTVQGFDTATAPKGKGKGGEPRAETEEEQRVMIIIPLPQKKPFNSASL